MPTVGRPEAQKQKTCQGHVTVSGKARCPTLLLRFRDIKNTPSPDLGLRPWVCGAHSLSRTG